MRGVVRKGLSDIIVMQSAVQGSVVICNIAGSSQQQRRVVRRRRKMCIRDGVRMMNMMKESGVLVSVDSYYIL